MKYEVKSRKVREWIRWHLNEHRSTEPATTHLFFYRSRDGKVLPVAVADGMDCLGLMGILGSSGEVLEVYDLSMDWEEQLASGRAWNPPGAGAATLSLVDLLATSVDVLPLPVRAANCLQNARVRTLGELVRLHPKDLLQVKNLGRATVRTIQDCLQQVGLSLSDKPPDQPEPLTPEQVEQIKAYLKDPEGYAREHGIPTHLTDRALMSTITHLAEALDTAQLKTHGVEDGSAAWREEAMDWQARYVRAEANLADERRENRLRLENIKASLDAVHGVLRTWPSPVPHQVRGILTTVNDARERAQRYARMAAEGTVP